MAEPDHIPDDSNDEASPREKPMGFLDHLEELRWTLVKSLIVFIIAFVIIGIFLKDARDILNWPLKQGLGDQADTFRMITTSPMAVFSTLIMMCFLGAVPIALPFMLFFLGQFVAPALTRKEMRLVLPACLGAVVLFLAGAAFTYFFLVPTVVAVSIAYSNEWLETEFLWQADKYYSMLTWMVLGLGAAFQFPLILLIAVHLKLVAVETLRSWRRIVVIGCFIAAAIITPTGDFLTMSIVALPLWLLYEMAIVVAGIYVKRRDAREALEELEESD